MTLRHRLNPRLHIAAAIGWAVFGVVTLAALLTAHLAAGQAEQRARADAEALLAEFATQVRDAVSMSLETRRSLLLATAAQVSAADAEDPAALNRTLLDAQAQFPEFVWLGVADAAGQLVAETGGPQRGLDVSALAWFEQGRRGPFVSDRHAELPGRVPASAVDGPAPHLIDIAAPVRSGGTLVAFLSWGWVEQRVFRMQQAFNKNRRVELMLATRDGTVLVGPAHWLGRRLAADLDASEGGAYVIGTRAHLRLADGVGVQWTAIVRQRAELALAPARTTRNTLFLTVFAAGLLSAAAAAWVTRLLTRRLARLAIEAEAVRRGERRSLAAPAGTDEVSRIGATLAQVVDHLQTEKHALQTLNVELDQRVAERTLRIERMADDARHAAVTRERLRMARDLHDTLAHSLMALLTQIRLVRKLRTRLDGEELDAELGRAETVATSGLVDARAAIAQMRDNGVRDSGLGPALQDLARRFGERTGVHVSLAMDPLAAKPNDERAETVFRIVEEALRNVERHAAAQQVRITLRGTAEAGSPGVRVQLEVVDDGIGFDPALPRPGHYGLHGIREQAALIGATLGVHSAPGQGSRIELAFDS
ncbi:histidine kinase [Aquabacterium sp.]|uniref:sensor histidine kinase n=1 Tax=Aquabacterium sp. TaxID=1872578 RepID=UPI002CC82EA6|nr:histidine kinase [Aquabacterium sp.]HSW07723.1 histidine kinase [Aquabacterium sp.]